MYRATTLMMSLGVALVAASGCRFSYDIITADEGSESPSAGTGGSQLGGAGSGDGDGGPMASSGSDSAVGGSGNGGTSTGGMASGGTLGAGGGLFVGDLVVTIGGDEDDAGASAEDPLGSGLSLREAIKIANADGGPISISIEPGLTLVPTFDLPTLVSKTAVYGNGATLDFSSVSSSKECMLVDGGSVHIYSIQLTNCSEEPVYFRSGSNHQIADSYFSGNAKSIGTTPSSGAATIGPGNTIIGGQTHAVFLNSAEALVIDNLFIDVGGNGGAAVFVGGAAVRAQVIGNLMVRARNGIVFSSNGDNVIVWHNTIVASLATGINVGQATGLDIRNNIVSHSGLFGINASSSNLAQFDYNLWFNTTNCNGCAAGLGTNSLLEDPRYVNFGADDYQLDTGYPSLALDAGTIAITLDRNGSDAGNYNGSGPDLGYSESN